jgi:hypothetical protein
MCVLFRIAHFLAAHRLPLSLFADLVCLHKINGVDVGNTYANADAVKDFIQTIAKTVKESVAARLQRADFIGITADASTDRTRSEQEAVDARIVEDGCATDLFVGMPGLTDAVRAIPLFFFDSATGCGWNSRRNLSCLF